MKDYQDSLLIIATHNNTDESRDTLETKRARKINNYMLGSEKPGYVDKEGTYIYTWLQFTVQRKFKYFLHHSDIAMLSIATMLPQTHHMMVLASV